MDTRRLSFGSFVLDLERGMLFESDAPVALGSKGLALLRTLVEAGGEPVTKAALMDAAWPSTSIEESNLSVQVAQLRKRLSNSSDSDEWIVTVPRVGYRFAGRLADPGAGAPLRSPVLPLNRERPSVAVLPFNNMSSDPEQEYFAEGLSEDLITDLSKVPGLMVIARNSSFAYKGRPVDVRQVARELGVRYVIEGSVRRAESRVRINAQIIDALDHSHLWADRFDRDLKDVFLLQDEIVGRIVDALGGALPAGALSPAPRPANIEAYDLAVRGRVLSLRSPEDAQVGREQLERAIALEPSFAEAHAWLAMAHVAAWGMLGEPVEAHRGPALAAGQRGVELDPTNADAHANLGYVLLWYRRPEEASKEIQRALSISPNHADAWVFLAELTTQQGNAVAAIELMRNSFRLNPYAPGWYHWILGFAQYAAGRYEEAVTTLRHHATRKTPSQRILAASLANLGRIQEAQDEARQFLTMVPNFSATAWAETQFFQRAEDREHFIDGYLKAGLPM